MRQRILRSLILGSTAALAVCLLAGPATARGRKSHTFRVMTFNIRFDFPNDGAKSWDNRLKLVADTIEESKAEVVLLQEDKRHQIDDLRKAFPKWEFLGEGRNGTGSGERCAVGFDQTAWKPVSQGDLALSDTPEKLGSNTWGTRYPHKLTWAVLESRKAKKKVLFVSTHFQEGYSDEDEAVRVKSAKVIRDFLEQFDKANKKDIPVVVGGDFNADYDEEPHEVLCGEDAPLRLFDVWEVVKPNDPSPGTIHGFKGRKVRKRIDWILFSKGIVPRAAAVNRYNQDGRYPSDHYPVVADFTVR